MYVLLRSWMAADPLSNGNPDSSYSTGHKYWIVWRSGGVPSDSGSIWAGVVIRLHCVEQRLYCYIQCSSLMARQPRLVFLEASSRIWEDKVRFTSESDCSMLRGTCNILSTEISRSGHQVCELMTKKLTYGAGGNVPGRVVHYSAPFS